MSAGLEVRGKSMRIWMKTHPSEPVIKETLIWPFTPENVEKAKKLAELIKLEIELDQFNLAKHFPNSRHLKKNQMSYYIAQYKEMIRWEVAPSTFDGYYSHIKKHVTPRWAKIHPKDIDTAAVKKWINELKENLAPKTIREVITRLASIHELWRQENKIPYNPFENIVIKQLDNLEPDPFSKTEISMILGAMANQDIQNLLPCIFWTGLSISEQISIAWEDINLEKGTIQVNRNHVKGLHKVTKNRRRKREIKLLQPAIQALRRQYAITGNRYAQVVNVLQRDNRTYKQERLHFVWINQEYDRPFNYYELRYIWRRHLKRPVCDIVELIREDIHSQVNYCLQGRCHQNGSQISLAIVIHQ
jgi:integrase